MDIFSLAWLFYIYGLICVQLYRRVDVLYNFRQITYKHNILILHGDAKLCIKFINVVASHPEAVTQVISRDYTAIVKYKKKQAKVKR